MKNIVVFLLLLSNLAFASEFKVYDFKSLQVQLGYPNETLFNSTEDQISDLDTYTSKEDTWYKDINTFLRQSPNVNYDWDSIAPDDAKKMVSNIDQIYKNVPELPKDLILFRGVDLNYRKSVSFHKNDEFIEKGYASTSTTFKVANYFANEMNYNDQTKSKKAILMLYSTKTNLKGILIDQGEDEVLLPHGLKIKIMEIDQSKKYDFYLAQICPQDCELNTDPSILKKFNAFEHN